MKKILFTLSILALLFVGSCTKDEISVEQPDPIVSSHLSSIEADSLEAYVRWLSGMGSRWALNDNRRDVAVAIRNKFMGFGYMNARLDSFVINAYNYYTDEYAYYWQYNVIATLEGSTHPDSIYIVGGHYDSVNSEGDSRTDAPGANDNASGVAATLEIARVLQRRGFAPRSTIKFIAFAAEELGLHGSWAHSEKARERGMKISMMLNNDMIAYWPGYDPYVWEVNIMDYPNSTSLRQSAYNICDLYTSLVATSDNKYASRSDSYPYYKNGYRALFFHNGAEDSNYHTSRDVPEACNFDYCAEVTRLTYAMLMIYNR